MKDKNKKRLLLCFCCAMAISALPLGFTSCKKDKKPTSSVEVNYGEEGVYYTNVDGKECLLTLIDKSNSFTLVIGSEVVVGTYSYNGKDFKLKFAGAKDSTVAVYEDDTLTFVYNEKTYTFVLKVDYTVTLDVDGAKTTNTVVNGQLFAKPADPVKEGYNFIGWYADSDYKTPFLFESMPVSANITLYARFVEKIAGAQEYVVTYVVDGEETNTAKTVSGAIYDLPTPEKQDKEFLGWWTSDYQDATKLTAEYKAGQTIKENTKLYAVWKSDDLNASVTAQKITWRAKNASANYTVKIYNAQNAVVNGNGKGEIATTTEYAFDFSKQAVGDYKIEIIFADEVASTVYYRNKVLDRVSVFEVSDNVLTFAGVDNAEKYVLTVDCGNAAHDHTKKIELGTSTFYNFADCGMQKGGIKFTVEAMAEGYGTSVSETYVYERNLEAVTGLAVNASTGEVGWNRVPNATSYIIEITVGGKTYTIDVGANTMYSLKDFTGALTIKVYPVAKGYNSSEAQSLEYTKETLAAPQNVVLKNKTLEWTAVAGASKYIVKIGDKEFEATQNKLTLTESHYDESWDKVQVYVKAVGADASKASAYSVPLSIRISNMSELKYVNGSVTWEAVVSATKYFVVVNGQTPKQLDATATSFKPTFDRKGVNSISVYYYNDEEESSTAVDIDIYAYRINFEVEGGERVASLYKATGDEISLDNVVTEKAGYDFMGWYTAAGGASGTGVEYTDKIYQDSGDRTLYASWSAKKYALTFNVQGGNEIQEPVEVTFKENFTLPIPTNPDPSYVFAGWFNQDENGVIGNVQYTDEQGKSVASWSVANATTVSAKWLHVLQFTQASSGVGDRYYIVSAGRDIRNVTSVTIPAMYDNAPVSVLSETAFAGFTHLLEVNIPDTIKSIPTGLGGANVAQTPFQGCTNLKAINIYCADEAHGSHNNANIFIPTYSSSNGVLIEREQNKTKIAYVPLAYTGKFEVPDAVTFIPMNTFKGSLVTEVVIPASVTEIQQQAFDGSIVEKITFEEGNENASLKIGGGAFKNCFKLVEITFPSHLDSFDETWFEIDSSSIYSSVLAKINVTEGGKYRSIDGVFCEGSKLVYVPVAFKPDNYTYTIPQGITTIGSKAFAAVKSGSGYASWKHRRTYVRNLIIPYYVTYIGSEAFLGCTDLQSVTFERDDKSDTLDIGYKAFHNCENLKTLTLPVKTGCVEEGAFGATRLLTKVTVLGGAEMEFEEGAFKDLDYNNFYLVDVVLGADVADVNIAGVFGGNIRAVEVDPANENFISGTEQAGDAGVLYTKDADNGTKKTIVFFPTTKTGEFVLPDEVTEISADVFREKRISKIVIGPNVTKIGVSAFQDSAITEIEFKPATGAEEKDLVIGTYAFRGTGILSMNLPTRVVELGDGAFQSCTNLTSVSIGAKTTKMGTYKNGVLTTMKVFEACSALQTVTIDAGNTAFKVIDGVVYGTTAVTTGEGDEATTEYVVTDLYFCPRANVGGEDGAVVIPNTVMKVWDKAFESVKNINSVSFDGAVEEDFSFGAQVFYQSAIANISLPSGLTEISANMFASCNSLTKVVVPNTVYYIDVGAFSNCRNLAEIEFEAGNDDNELELSDAYGGINGVIRGCSSLTEINLPARTGWIGDYAFNNNENLKTVNVPKGVYYFGASVFMGCPNLETVAFAKDGILREINDSVFEGATSLETVILPDNLDYIGVNAFKDCKNLLTINIPNQVTEISAGAFENAVSLEAVIIDLENSELAIIGERAFFNCTSLNRTKAVLEEDEAPVFTLPKTVTTIKVDAFNRCESLIAFTVATPTEGGVLTSIEDQAFAYSGLKTFIFPNTAYDDDTLVETKYGKKIFAGCRSLTSITLSNAITQFDGLLQGCYSITEINIDESNEYFSAYNENGVVFLMNADGTEYKYVLGSLGGTLKIKDTITAIGAGTFANLAGVTAVEIPASVQSIGNNAFKNCKALEKVTILTGDAGSALISIGTSAFEGCSKLGANDGGINLESATSLAAIGSKAFLNCSALATVVLPNSVTTVGANAFQNSGLTSVNIPENVKEIPASAFEGCASLTDAQLHQYITKLGDKAFKGTALTTESVNEILTLVPEQTKYGNYVFMNCTAITSVTIPALMTEIPAALFEGCTALAEIKFHDNITKLGNRSFYNCKALTSVTLPKNLATIGSNVFVGAQFTSIDMSQSPITSIGKNAFESTALTSVTIPNGVLTLGANVFKNCTDLVTVNFHDAFEGRDSATVTGANYGPFYGCTSLGGETGVSLPASVKDIAYFFANSGVKKVTIKAGLDLTAITGYAFYNCANLVEVDLDTTDACNVTTINAYAFYNCSSLTKFVIPNTVTELKQNAFENCKSLSTLAIPETVTTIGGSCFKGSGITSLDLSKVTSLGASATENCASLTKLVLNDEILTLPSNILKGTASLSSFALPAKLSSLGSGSEILKGSGITKLEIPAGVRTFPSSAFKNSPALKEVVFNCDGVIALPYNGFVDCKKLETVTFGENCQVTSFNDTFRGCSALVNFSVPDTVTSIGPYEFKDCVSLKNIVLPANVKQVAGSTRSSTLHNQYPGRENYAYSVNQGLFSGCTSLETVVLPEIWTYLPNLLFYNCVNLTKVTLPKALTEIKEYAFFGTAKLTNFTIPETVKTIGQYAFMDAGLSLVAIPAKVTSIGAGAFGGNALQGFVVDSANTTFRSDGNGILYKDKTIVAYPLSALVDENGVFTMPTDLPAGVKFGGGSIISDKIKHIIVPEGITSIPSDMFANMVNLETVTLPEGLTSIGMRAFWDCPSLKTVHVPSTLTTINEEAFNYCPELVALEGCDAMLELDYIGKKAFMNCSKLATMAIPKSVTYVGAQAFENCTAMAIDVELAEDGEMGNNAFNKSGIISFVVPASITVIGDEDEREGTVPYYTGGWMTNMPNLERLDLNKLEIIGSWAFNNNPKLATITYSDALWAISNYAFSNCGLTEFTVKPTLTAWGAYVFSGNTSLEVVTFEEGVKELRTAELGDPYEIRDYGYMFANCTALHTVNIPATMEYIDTNAFSGCTAIENLVLPSGITIGASAFSGVSSTVYVESTELEVNDLWNASWKSGITGQIVYGYQKPQDGGDTSNTDGE